LIFIDPGKADPNDKTMQSPLVGHPQRIEPFKDFLGVIARDLGPILITGPTGSGKKRIIEFLIKNGPLKEFPIFFLNELSFSDELWASAGKVLGSKGTLVVETLQYHPLAFQVRFKRWLAGQGSLGLEPKGVPPEWRIIVTGLRPEDLWEDLIYDFPYHIELPPLQAVVEDIPYHIKFFLQDKPIRYIRYFFLLKTFIHQWPGNLRELEHYLIQTMAYYNSLDRTNGSSGGEAVFGEKRMRYYQDVLKEEWWYYPYRFPPGFAEGMKEILTKTDFRSKIIEDQLVLSLLKDEPGFLVLDLSDPEFEKKAIALYSTFLNYFNAQSGQDP
jgi:hypothetical protein